MRSARAIMAVALAAVIALTTTVPASAAGPYDEYEDYFDSHKTNMPFTDTRWVPQGMTKRGENQLVIAYYDRHGTKNSIIGIADRATGKRLKYLRLDTTGHVGGLAMTSKWFWVATNGVVYRYNRSQLNRANGAKMNRSYTKDVKGLASYAYAEGETVWVGNFSSGNDYQWMYQYRVNSANELSYVQDRRTPSKVQGVALTPSKIIWSQSWGRNSDSKLIIWKRDRTYDRNWDYGNVLVAPPMTQGLVIANSRLFVDYESGADKYDGTADGKRAKVVIRKLHHGTIPPWT